MTQLNFVDTTLRDGAQSLWAGGIRTGMILPVAAEFEKAGFKAVELMGANFFKKCTKDLREDPWDRIRSVSKIIKNTPMSITMLHSITAFGLTPLSALKLYFERLAANGLKILQILEPSNDFSFRIPECVKYAHDAGLKVTLALTYSHSPKHTDEYFAVRARQAAALKVDTVYLKDPGGLLTPERVKTLVPVIFKNINGTPLEIHSHCTTGLAPICYLEAAKAGITTFYTGIPPLANGSAEPSIFNFAKNARAMGYDLSIDEETLRPIASHFDFIARKENLPIGAPVEYDLFQYSTQVPGGVISNLRYQLNQIKMGDKLGAVLDEIVRVRQELGYPIMVTPFSQFVASQAAINIIVGERYKTLTDEIIQYAIGLWGKEANSNLDPNVKDKILSNPRAIELSKMEAYEPSIEEIKQKYGTPGISDDELLLRYICGEADIKAMRAADPPREYISTEVPLIKLLQELTRQDTPKYIHIQKGSFSCTLGS